MHGNENIVAHCSYTVDVNDRLSFYIHELRTKDDMVTGAKWWSNDCLNVESFLSNFLRSLNRNHLKDTKIENGKQIAVSNTIDQVESHGKTNNNIHVFISNVQFRKENKKTVCVQKVSCSAQCTGLRCCYYYC